MSGEHGYELGTDGPRTILVGVDGSDTSMRALAYAAGLARRQHSVLVAVYARPLGLGPFAAADRTGAAAESALRAQDETEAELRRVLDRARPTHPQVRFVVRRGDAFTVLTAVADDVRADAVVVGASTRVGHRLTGSLAVRLVRAGRWPVTVVP